MASRTLALALALTVAATLVLAGCFTGKDPPALDAFGGASDGVRTDVRRADTTTVARDRGVVDGCALGTPNSCASCSDVCPGIDDGSSGRTCKASRCGLVCKGDHYDVDGDVANGCEIADDLPLHATEATARDVGTIIGCGNNEQQIIGRIPSDAREHARVPLSRLHGVPDYFTLEAQDKTTCVFNPKITLDASAVAPSVLLRLDVTFRCNNGARTVLTKSLTARGGQSTPLSWTGLNCVGTIDETGVMLLRVEKDSASTGHSAGQYVIKVRL